MCYELWPFEMTHLYFPLNYQVIPTYGQWVHLRTMLVICVYFLRVGELVVDGRSWRKNRKSVRRPRLNKFSWVEIFWYFWPHRWTCKTDFGSFYGPSMPHLVAPLYFSLNLVFSLFLIRVVTLTLHYLLHNYVIFYIRGSPLKIHKHR